jgi:LysR family cyn operon transcriptional activator
MELRHLRYFIRAAELLHFTRAAESLYISQPTLSVHIQQLEEELGTPLFVRVGRHVRLTQAGDVLLNRARQALRELEIASEEIDGLVGLFRGNLRVAALYAFSEHLLPSWLASFNATHPNVHVIAKSAVSDDIEQGLVDGTIDLGFSFVPVVHDEIHSEELFKEQIVLAVSKKHPFANRKKFELSDCNDLAVALPSRRIVARRLLDDYLEQSGVSLNVVVEYDDVHALTEIVKMGSLATFLTSIAVGEDPEFQIFPLPNDRRLCLTAAALWTHMSPAARVFLEIAKESTAKSPPSKKSC